MDDFDFEKQREIMDKIIQLLQSEGCTVRQANHLLTLCQNAINRTAPVQFVPGFPYLF